MVDTILYMRTSNATGFSNPITDRTIDDLYSLILVDDVEMKILVAHLEGAGEFLKPEEIPDLLKSLLPNDVAASCGRAIEWLHRNEREGTEFEHTIRKLSSADAASKRSERKFSEEHLKKLEARAKMLSRLWRQLDRQKKAEELGSYTGQRLQKLQITCDLRPVFDSSRKVIEGLLPVTTFRIVAEGVDGLPVGMDVILSESDVESMSEHLKHVKAKVASLKEIARTLQIPVPSTELTTDLGDSLS